MLTIETKELEISDKLKRKVEMICRFTNTKAKIENGSIQSIKNTNIAYVKPHIITIKNNEYPTIEKKQIKYFDIKKII